jgi:CheY-like chemotaxis protein
MFSLLCVDDKPEVPEAYHHFLERKDKMHVKTAGFAEEELRLLNEQPSDTIVSDYIMPEMDGIALLQRFFPRNWISHSFSLPAEGKKRW